jgi:hypothetical protein
MLRRNNKGQYLKIAPEERFWDKVQKTDDCWNWTGARDSHGYGTLDINGKKQKAHRLSLNFIEGEIPSEIKVCHKCDNTLCVRPEHLFLGTQADNLRDMQDKGRASDYFKKKAYEHPKSKFTEEDIRKIKKLYTEDGISQRKIAPMFNVAQQTISKIITGKRYS